MTMAEFCDDRPNPVYVALSVVKAIWPCLYGVRELDGCFTTNLL